MSKSIYVSPSNQKENIGVGEFGDESSRMNRIADVVQRILEGQGITVFRNKPDWDLSKIVEDSNQKSPVIHLAIHSNADDGEFRGCEVFCHKFGGEGERLARLVYDEVSAITPTNDRGVKQGFNFYGQGKSMYELWKTNAPAALVEVAFHDNSEDANWIMGHIETIGIAIANAVLRYFCITIKEVVSDLSLALSVLQKKGIINSPEYWMQNAVKGKMVNGEYVAIMIKRAASYLREDLSKR